MQTHYKELNILYHDTASVRGAFNHPLYMPATYDRELVAKHGADELWRKWKVENPTLKPYSAVERNWKRGADGVWELVRERYLYQERLEAVATALAEAGIHT